MQTRMLPPHTNSLPHQLQSGHATRPAPSRGSLPAALQAGIERLSGIGMADVQVHYNSPQPAQLEALAFAQGTDIHLGPGQERHLPHEAWHVVQQKQGRVNGTLQTKGVSINTDLYLEREADQMGERALHGGSRDEPWQPPMASETAPVHQLRPVIQRLKTSELPIADGYESLTSHSTWLEKAEAYEKKLGIYAYSHASATSAVNTGLNRMKAVIDRHYQSELAEADKKLSLYRDVFTKDDAGSAGQIGKAVSQNDIDTMLTGGNLRERMTAFYNAAYYNSPSGGTPLRGFKQILQAILFEEQAGLASTLALDEQDLNEKSAFLSSPLRQSTKWLTSFGSKGYNFADDPFALGNLTLAEETGGTVEMGLSQSERVTRPDTERPAEKRTADDYEALRIGLSDREKAYTASKMGKLATDPDYSTTKLPWLEGHTYYKMVKSPTLGYSWINEIRDTLHMPVVAGVSGTTTRMLTAYKWLGCTAPENFRLALMGWMLPAWDHSLYEIMRGSHLAGVKPAADSDLTDVVDMYMNIAPLTTDDLRANVAINKQFPHEAVYMERTKDNTSLDADGFLSAFTDNKNDATTKYAAFGTGIAGFSAAHSTALYNYTSGIHSLMNATLSMPALLAKETIYNKLLASAEYECRDSWFRAHSTSLSTEENAQWTAMKAVEPIDVLKKGLRITSWKTLCASYTSLAAVETLLARTVRPWISSIIDPLYEEMKIHANMTTEALKALPAVTGVDVWRGDWSSMIGSRYEEGNVITHDTLTSYSRDKSTAEGFTQSGKLSYKVLIKLTLSGKGGRDIEDYSRFPEREVLMMPKSKVKITKVTWGKDAKGDDLKLCEAVEV